jgi:outer membrane protein assembly factor BamB
MKNANRWIAAITATLVLVGATCALAQDWPQWRGANRDGKVAGFTAPQAWPKELSQKWKTSVGPGDSTPALVGDKLYVTARQGDDETILCLDAATGKEVWRDKYAAQAVTGAAAKHPGPRGSPAVADGKVVALGAGGVVSCLDAATGKVAWRNTEFTKAVPMFFTGMSPIIFDGVAVLHLGGKGDGAMVAFDLASGSIKWKWAGDGPAYDSPVLVTADGTKQIVTVTEKGLVGVSAADGKLLWQTPAVPGMRMFNSASPILDGNIVIFTGQGKGTRAVKIEKQGNAFAAKDVWANEETGAGYNTPVLKDGLLFGLSEKGNLFCIDAKTGKTCWTDATPRGKSFGSVVDAGSVLFALPSTGELVVYKPSDKEFSEVTHYKVADTATYAYPVIAGKRIFVRDQDSIILWSME